MRDSAGLQIADPGDLNPAGLNSLLAEESAEWARELDWDNSNTANLVRTLFAGRRLGGAVLLDRGEPVGYGYLGLEGNRGLVAGMYVQPLYRTVDAESTLLLALFDRLIGMPSVRRIEAQLMLVEAGTAKVLERERQVRIFERALMTLGSDEPLPAPFTPARATQPFRIQTWSDDYSASAGETIQAAYAGHVDSWIHERYSSAGRAAGFVRELVAFPGASFCRPASFMAFDPDTGSATGLVLCSFTAPGIGHIAEICVVPESRSSGLGQELLRRAVEALRGEGARRISLAVTIGNEPALRLYRRLGFREKRRFHAYVWSLASL